MKKFLLITTTAILLFITPLLSSTLTSVKNGKWSNPTVWDGNRIPGKLDDVIISSRDTVTVDLGSDLGNANCNTLTNNGTLTFTNDSNSQPANLIVDGAFENNGLLIAATDTSFNIPDEYGLYVYGNFINDGAIKTNIFNTGDQENKLLDISLFGNSLTASVITHLTRLDVESNVSLTDTLICDNLYLYKKLNDSKGEVIIPDDGVIWRSDSGSITNAPIFGKDIDVIYGSETKLVTGPELPDVVRSLNFGSDIVLNKSVVVNKSIIGNNNQYGPNSYIYTGKNRIILSDSTLVKWNVIIGNVARIYSTKDSLIFPVLGTAAHIVTDTLTYPIKNTAPVSRPIAIKLNNFNGSPDTITVSMHDTVMNSSSLPPGVAASEKYHYWKITASSNYAGKVDANVSLSWYNNQQLSDYVNNKYLVTVLNGNAFSGEWTSANNAAGVSYINTPFYNSSYYHVVTGKSFHKFGDFTLGEIYKLPNNSFEDWGNAPYGWIINNLSYAAPISKSSDAYSGSYSVEGDVVSYNNLGQTVYMQPDLKLVLPFEKFPNSLSGFYKFTSSGNDKFVVSLTAYKDSSAVAKGVFVDSNNVSRYQKFNLNISPISQKPVSPSDSIVIDISMQTGDSNQFHVGSKFWVDDLSFDTVTAVKNNTPNIPVKFRLYQNYPNPFNPSTNITFSIPHRSHILLKVYDILGRKVATLINSNIASGVHHVVWNADNYSSGVYFYQLKDESDHKIITKKMLLLK